jgi:PPOX class probable F420-dependent enzyme
VTCAAELGLLSSDGMALLNPDVPGQAHADSRLRGESVIWLATTTRSGAPHAVPVWFWWHDPVVTLFSRPDTGKIAHLRARPQVALHLDTASHGGDVVLLRGRAVPGGPGVDLDDEAERAFGAKYAPMLGGASFGQWRETFSLPVVVTVASIVAWRATADGLEQLVVPG